MKSLLGKMISCVLITVMLAGMMTVSAVTIEKRSGSFDYDSITELIDTLEDTLDAAGSVAARNELFNWGKYYLEDDDRLDDLMEIVYVITPSTVIEDNDPLKSLKELLKSLSAQKTELLFALSFIKSIDESDRADALDAFKDRIGYLDYENVSFSSKETTALNSVYSNLVSAGFRQTLLSGHQIDAMVMLTLFSCVEGEFMLTDSSSNSKKLAVKSVSSGFANRFVENLEVYFTSVNSKSLSSGTNKAIATAILEALVEKINSGETNDNIADYKTLFGKIGLYEARSSGGSPTSPTGPGITIYQPPTDAMGNNQPVVIPTPFVTADTGAAVGQFSDLESSRWSAPYIGELTSRKIFRGYEDGQFKPAQGITREELAVTMIRALGLETRLASATNLPYTDVDKISDWAKSSVALATELGIYVGYDDGSFQPKRVISREEMSALIARSLTKQAPEVALTFTDKAAIGAWALASVEKAYALGIVKGYEDTTFRPQNTITREEVVTIIYNFMYTENLL